MKANSDSGHIINICSKLNFLSWNISSSYCCQSAHTLSLEIEVFHHSIFFKFCLCAVGALRQTNFTEPGKMSVQHLKQEFVKMSWSCNGNQMADVSWPFSDGAAKFLSVWNQRECKMTPSLEDSHYAKCQGSCVNTSVAVISWCNCPNSYILLWFVCRWLHCGTGLQMFCLVLNFILPQLTCGLLDAYLQVCLWVLT